MTIKGYPTQEKTSAMEYTTVSPLGPQDHGLDVRNRSYYELDTGTVQADPTDIWIDTDFSETARKGDILHFVDGVLEGLEVSILSVSGTELTIPSLGSLGVPTAADNIRLLRAKTPEVDNLGSIPVSVVIGYEEDTAQPVPAKAAYIGGIDDSGDLRGIATTTAGVLKSTFAAAPATTFPPESASIAGSDDLGVLRPVTVDGSGRLVTVVQSSALPSGAATSALQTTGNAILTTIDADTGVMAGLLATIDADTGTMASLLGTIDADTGNIATSTASVAVDTAVIAGDTTSIDTKTPALGQAAMAASVPVAIANNQSAIPVKQSGYTSSALITHDHASGNVTNAAYVEIDASLAAAAKRLHIFDSSGEALILATGAVASEVDLLYIPPGGFSCPVDIDIAATTRLSIKALSTTTTVGTLIITALG